MTPEGPPRRTWRTLVVVNTGDRPIRVGSHLLGPHRVVNSALALGREVSTSSIGEVCSSIEGCGVFELAEPGRLVRRLGAEAHASPVAALWARGLAGGPLDRTPPS